MVEIGLVSTEEPVVAAGVVESVVVRVVVRAVRQVVLGVVAKVLVVAGVAVITDVGTEPAWASPTPC